LAIQQIHETKQRDVKKKLRWYTKYRKLKKKVCTRNLRWTTNMW